MNIKRCKTKHFFKEFDRVFFQPIAKFTSIADVCFGKHNSRSSKLA